MIVSGVDVYAGAVQSGVGLGPYAVKVRLIPVAGTVPAMTAVSVMPNPRYWMGVAVEVMVGASVLATFTATGKVLDGEMVNATGVGVGR